MNHKSFVFFDCECANTFDGVGKICSLGYVICDDDLNIIESEDVVMNPECDFDWYLLSGKGDCKLAYSKDYFRTKPNFESYYKDVKKLLRQQEVFINKIRVFDSSFQVDVQKDEVFFNGEKISFEENKLS